MKRWGKRMLWFGVGVVLLLTALFIFFVTIPSHKISQSLNAALAEILHSDVKIGKAEISFFPRPHYLLQNILLQPRENTLFAGPTTIEEISGSFAWWPVITKKRLETNPIFRGLKMQIDLSGATPLSPSDKPSPSFKAAYEAKFELLEIAQSEITLLLPEEQLQLHKVRARITKPEELMDQGAQIQLASFWGDSTEQLSLSGNVLFEPENKILHVHQLRSSKGNTQLLMQGSFLLPSFSPQELRITGTQVAAQSVLSWLFPGSTLPINGTIDLESTLTRNHETLALNATLDASNTQFSFPPWFSQAEHYPLKFQVQAEKTNAQTKITEAHANMNGMNISFAGDFPNSGSPTWKSSLSVTDLSSAKTQAPFLALFSAAENIALHLEQAAANNPAQLGARSFQLSAKSLDLLDNHFAEIEAHGVANTNQLSLTGLKTNWLNGTLSGSGEYSAQEKTSLNFSLTGQNLSLVEWPQIRKQIDAQASLILQAKGEGIDLINALNEAAWEGTLLAEQAQIPQLKIASVFSPDTIDFINNSRSSPLMASTSKQLSVFATPNLKLRLDFQKTNEATEITLLHLENSLSIFEGNFSLDTDDNLTGSAKLSLAPSLSQSFFEKPEWYRQSTGLDGKLSIPLSMEGKRDVILLRLQKNELLALLAPQQLNSPAPAPLGNEESDAPPIQPKIENQSVSAPENKKTSVKSSTTPKTGQKPQKPKKSDGLDEDSFEDLLKVIIP